MTHTTAPGYHVGRSPGGPGHLEAACPCPKAACGLVDSASADPACDQHHGGTKTIRSSHRADACPGPPPPAPGPEPAAAPQAAELDRLVAVIKDALAEFTHDPALQAMADAEQTDTLTTAIAARLDEPGHHGAAEFLAPLAIAELITARADTKRLRSLRDQQDRAIDHATAALSDAGAEITRLTGLLDRMHRDYAVKITADSDSQPDYHGNHTTYRQASTEAILCRLNHPDAHSIDIVTRLRGDWTDAAPSTTTRQASDE